MKITRDEYAKSYVIEVEGKFYYWNPPIESRLNQKEGAIEAPSQEPVATVGLQHQVWNGVGGQWFPPGEPVKQAMLLKDLPIGPPLYTTQPDAAAQIAYLERSDKAAWRKANELQEQIAKLQAEAKTLATANYDNQCELQARITQLTAAARMAHTALMESHGYVCSALSEAMDAYGNRLMHRQDAIRRDRDLCNAAIAALRDALGEK